MPETAATPPAGTVTALLEGAPEGAAVVDRLLPVVYDELRRMARRHLAREHRGGTLDTSALVHEAYLKLVDRTRVPVRSRAYFFAAAARAMRQILVDHARYRLRQKRGGGQAPATLKDEHVVVDGFAAELLDLDAALDRLSAIEPRAARLVECRFFGGLSMEETAEALGVSARTLRRDWTMAQAWLFRALRAPSTDGHHL